MAADDMDEKKNKGQTSSGAGDSKAVDDLHSPYSRGYRRRL